MVCEPTLSPSFEVGEGDGGSGRGCMPRDLVGHGSLRRLASFQSSPDGKGSIEFLSHEEGRQWAEEDGVAPAWTRPFNFVDLSNRQALVSMLVS